MDYQEDTIHATVSYESPGEKLSGNYAIHALHFFTSSTKSSRCEVFFSIYTFLADWVAVGFSDRGELTGADFCVFWVDWKGGAQVQVSSSTLFLGIFIST